MLKHEKSQPDKVVEKSPSKLRMNNIKIKKPQKRVIAANPTIKVEMAVGAVSPSPDSRRKRIGECVTIAKLRTSTDKRLPGNPKQKAINNNSNSAPNRMNFLRRPGAFFAGLDCMSQR